MHVLLVGAPETLPEGVGSCLANAGWDVALAPDVDLAAERAKCEQLDAVVVAGQSQESPQFAAFLRSVDTRRIAALVVGGDSGSDSYPEGSLIDLAGADVSKEEITRRLATLTRFQTHLRRVEDEVDNMQRLGKRLNQHFREIDDELRLASRLQRDFLPRDVDTIGPLRFGTVYRPASWVSGDMFDIQRIDETHVGFYIADAVGHGMAAGLLTMYVKRAIVTKRIKGSQYQILLPGETLQILNDALCEHALPNCQFVTVVYCVINTETLIMQYARGGHPYPLLIPPKGQACELKSSGGLMGLFQGFECATGEVQLATGDKVVLYTDGIEAAFDHVAEDTDRQYAGHRGVLESLGAYSATDMAARLGERLDNEQGSLLPADDVTMVAVDIGEPGSCALCDAHESDDINADHAA